MSLYPPDRIRREGIWFMHAYSCLPCIFCISNDLYSAIPLVSVSAVTQWQPIQLHSTWTWGESGIKFNPDEGSNRGRQIFSPMFCSNPLWKNYALWKRNFKVRNFFKVGCYNALTSALSATVLVLQLFKRL